MPRHRASAPAPPPADVAERLAALYRDTDHRARIGSDPVTFVHRYRDPADQEIAGIYAAGLAFGRVDLFLPVLAAVFDHLDAHGGPRAWVDGLTPARAASFPPLIYRWNRGSDLALLGLGLRRALGTSATVESLLGPRGPLADRLGALITTLRDAVVAEAPALGLRASRFDGLPRGVRYLLPHPEDGSGCKRWNLYLRWMARPTTEGVDVGIWRSLRPAELLMPIDTHVGRIATFLGLLTRPDASWRAAEHLTARLRHLDPDDPVRFDFALAHVGISGGCLGHRDAEVCPTCPLDRSCQAPKAA